MLTFELLPSFPALSVLTADVWYKKSRMMRFRWSKKFDIHVAILTQSMTSSVTD